jgi:hypothetical protein
VLERCFHGHVAEMCCGRVTVRQKGLVHSRCFVQLSEGPQKCESSAFKVNKTGKNSRRVVASERICVGGEKNVRLGNILN